MTPKIWIVLSVLTIVVVVLLTIVVLLPSQSNASKIVTIWAAGGPQGYSPRNYSSQVFTLDSTEKITGSFTSDKGITLYIMNSTQYLSLRSNSYGVASAWVYTTGNVTSAILDTGLSSGTYYLVFENTNFNASLYSVSYVTITQSITANPA